jgi:carbamate kinase
MLVVIALGGILGRGKPMTADNHRADVRTAARALAPIAAGHQLVIVHGNGPLVDLLALEGAAYAKVEACPLDVLGAESEAMVGYLIEQELGNLLPAERAFATILTSVEVDAADPAFRSFTTVIGPVYLREEAERLAEARGWVFKPEGDKWRRVVASPEPRRICELRPIKWLLERNTIVIAAGGGGIPTMHEPGTDRRLCVECVIDSDLASGLLARELGADVFVMLTDADALYMDWDKPTRKAIRRASPDALRGRPFAAGAMGPKVDAACRFAQATGKPAAIGALADLQQILAGEAGTTVSAAESAVVLANALADVARG